MVFSGFIVMFYFSTQIQIWKEGFGWLAALNQGIQGSPEEKLSTTQPWAAPAWRHKGVLGCTQSRAASAIPSIRRTWSCWSKSRGGHEDDAGAAALLQRQAVRVGAVQPGVGKAFLRPAGLSSTWRVLEINRVSQDMSNPICTFLDRNLS